MNFTDFVTDIGKWINRTHGEIDDIIAQQIVESQYSLEKDNELWFLIDEYTHAISLGDTSCKLPNHTIKIRDIEIRDSAGVKYPVYVVSPERLRDIYPSREATSPDTGRPQMIAIMGHVLEFGPQADGAYTLHVTTHHHLDPLNATTNTYNVWTTTYLEALRFKVLIDLQLYIGADERAPLWQSRLDKHLADIKAEIMNTQMIGVREVITETEEVY